MNDFRDFLRTRFSPCIHVIASESVKTANPLYYHVIEEYWSEISRKHKDKRLRIVFPHELPKIPELQDVFISSRDIPPQKQQNYQTLELISTVKIREYLITLDYLQLDSFCDLPLLIIILVVPDENPSLNIKFYPNWARNFIVDTVQETMLFPNIDLYNLLEQYYLVSINKIYPNLIKVWTAEYNKYWGDFMNRISNYLNQVTSESVFRRLKFYGDILLQQQQYAKALKIYQQYIKAYNDELNPTYLSVLLMIICSQILDDTITQDLLGTIHIAKDLSNSAVTYYALVLIEYHVRLSLKMSPAVTFVESNKKIIKSDFARIISPFLIEQHAYYMSRRHASFKFYSASVAYKSIGALNLAQQMIRNAADGFNHESWMFLLQRLDSMIFEIQTITEGNPLDVVVDVVNSKVLTDPKRAKKMLKSFNFNTPFPCGFVQAKAIDYFAIGFAHSPPPGYDEWNFMIGRLFGAYTQGKFFNRKVIGDKIGVVGERIVVRVALAYPTSHYPIFDMSLLYCGKAKAEVSQITIGAWKYSVIDLHIIPTEPGKLEIYGIGFNWANVVHMETSFQNCPLVFEILPSVPHITYSIKEYCDTLYKGQISKLEITLKNCDHDLDYLSIFFAGDMQATLITPESENLLGMCKLPNLKAHEELTLELSIFGESLGDFDLLLLLPYWNYGFKPRYLHMFLHFTVYPDPPLHVERSLSAIQVLSPPGSIAHGFTTSRFDAQLHNVIKEAQFCLYDQFSLMVENGKFNPPKFVVPYIDEEKFLFWYQTYWGYVRVAFEMPESPVSVFFVHKSETKYDMEITNIGVVAIRDLIVHLGTNEHPTCIISGKSKQHFLKINPGETMKMSINLTPLTNIISFVVYAFCRQFTVSRTVSFDIQ